MEIHGKLCWCVSWADDPKQYYQMLCSHLLNKSTSQNHRPETSSFFFAPPNTNVNTSFIMLLFFSGSEELSFQHHRPSWKYVNLKWKKKKNLLLSTISFFEQNQTGQTPQSRSRTLCFRHGCLAASAERSHSLVNNYTLHHMLPPLRKKVAREKSSFRTQISAGVGSHQTHMMECRSAPFHNLSGETPGRPRDRSRLALRCVHPELRGPMFGMISPLCCMSSAWICPHRVCERNNVRVWGRRSAFWEYLWCFSSTLAFSSPNSPHSSAKDNTPFLSTRCAKKNGGGGQDCVVAYFFWSSSSPTCLQTASLCFPKCHSGKRNHGGGEKPIVLWKLLVTWEPPFHPPCSLSLESVIGWFKQTVDGWVPVICVPLIMGH